MSSTTSARRVVASLVRGVSIRSARLAALAAAVLALSCTQRRESAPNLLLVTLDTLRADHCSLYGYSKRTTPNLDRVAAAGVRVDPAYARMSITGPSHSTIFTGDYSLTHGVVVNGFALRGEATVDLERRIYLQRQPIEIRGRRVQEFGVRAGPFKYIGSEPENERELYELVADADGLPS